MPRKSPPKSAPSLAPPYSKRGKLLAELIDFLRFNVQYMTQIYKEQPESSPGIWNRLEYRPLEGFVFAITPFNFTAIAANLCAAPAMMGNVVVWKPADSQIYSAQVIMELFKAAGLPDGVVNMITVDGPVAGDVITTRCAESSLGINNPLDVDFTSSIADSSGV